MAFPSRLTSEPMISFLLITTQLQDGENNPELSVSAMLTSPERLSGGPRHFSLTLGHRGDGRLVGVGAEPE